MKLGASLGTEGGYLRSVGETARAAETLVFAGLWTSETKHDAFLQLAIAANETEKIELGTSVAIAFSPSPMETAHTAWDLQISPRDASSWASEPRCGSDITMARFRDRLRGREVTALEVALSR